MAKDPSKSDTIAHAMAVLSRQIDEDVPLQKVCLALADLIAELDLSLEQQREAVLLGSMIWKKSLQIGESEVHFVDLSRPMH